MASITTASTVAAPACGPLPRAEGGTWRCTFDDNFTAGSLDPTRWSVITNARQGWGWGYGCFVDDAAHVAVADGLLHLSATREPVALPCATTLEDGSTTTPYLTAAIETRNKFSQRYGRFEIRARLPRGQGLWPAFWMMPQDSIYGQWPASGEIDILEALGHQPDTAYATLHYLDPAGRDPNDSHACTVAPNWADDFHLYTLEWSPDEIAMFYDGVLCHRFTQWRSQVGGTAPFDQSFFLILYLAAGGRWPGAPDTTTPFPATFTVDYVRAWEAA